MIAGIGVDIVNIKKFTCIFKNSGRFRKRVFHNNEINYCESKIEKFQHYAARFAAKEAAMKALGTGWNKGVQWNNIQVVNAENNRPVLIFNGRIKEIIIRRKIVSSHVSLSHNMNYAIAFVILES